MPEIPVIVSVVTVVRNGESHIADTIESVMLQDYPYIEYIVVDGASTDNTLQIVERYAKHVDHLVSEPDSGIYEAFNKGIALATGKIVGILNSDDWYDKHTIKNVIKCFAECGAQVIFGDRIIVDRLTGTILRSIEGDLSRMRWDFSINHPTVFVERELYNNYRFREDYRVAADYELFSRLLADQVSFSYCPGDLVYMRTGGVSSGLRVNIERFLVQWTYHSRWIALFVFINRVSRFFAHQVLMKLGVKNQAKSAIKHVRRKGK